MKQNSKQRSAEQLPEDRTPASAPGLGLAARRISHHSCLLYDTTPRKRPPKTCRLRRIVSRRWPCSGREGRAVLRRSSSPGNGSLGRRRRSGPAQAVVIGLHTNHSAFLASSTSRQHLHLLEDHGKPAQALSAFSSTSRQHLHLLEDHGKPAQALSAFSSTSRQHLHLLEDHGEPAQALSG